VETGRNGKKREYFKRHVYIVLRIRQEDRTEWARLIKATKATALHTKYYCDSTSREPWREKDPPCI